MYKLRNGGVSFLGRLTPPRPQINNSTVFIKSKKNFLATYEK